MSVLDHLVGRRPQIHQSDFPVLIPKLALELEVMREQFIFGAVSALKSEGAPVSGISPILEKGCELDSALKAYQLTCIVGFSWNYMEFADQLPFDKALTQHLDDGDGHEIKLFRERYLNCEGIIETLSSSLAEDIHGMWGNPESPLPSSSEH